MTSTTERGRVRNAGRWAGNGREWRTPPELFAALDREFHFDLDPCSSHENALTERHFTEAEDGRLEDWGTSRVFMNPPYGRAIYAWTRKARQAAAAGALVVALLPASTDTAWWHEDVLAGGAEVRYIRGRVPFLDADGRTPPEGSGRVMFPSAIVIWRPK